MNRKSRPVVLAFLFLALVSLAVVLVLRYTSGVDGVETDTVDPMARKGRSHGPGEAGQADFLTILIYDAGGAVASYMVDGYTEEFDAFVGAVRGARPVEGVRDESFSQLLVFSFPDGSTMELPYSPSRGQLAQGDMFFVPAADLEPMILSVEERFD